MTLKDVLKNGKRKLFKSDHKVPLGVTGATSPPDFGLQIAGPSQAPAATLSIEPSPLIPVLASAPLEKSDVFGLKNDHWPNLTTLLGLLNRSALLTPLKAVLDDLSEFVRSYENAVAVKAEYGVLRLQLEALFKDLCGLFSANTSPIMTTSMLNLCEAIGSELENLNANRDRNTIPQFFQADYDLENISASYRRIQSNLERLMLNANLSIWSIVDKQATEIRLAKVTPSLSARYNSAEAALVRRRECTDRTREQVLLDLKAWKCNPDAEKVCWMSGMAGTGKTTIAMTLCSILDNGHELGASFFCNRSLPECRNVKLVWPTIAYQLARFSIPFQGALTQALERDPDVHTKALRVQFRHMILEPLQGVMRALPTNAVVVIDALDECEDDDGAEEILGVLLDYASKLPIKFFVSSRPEPYIRERVAKSALTPQMILHELDEKTVTADIRTYLREELSSVSLTDSQLGTLVERAGVLFIYAATVVRYIKSGNSRKRLDTMLQASGPMPASGQSPSNKTKEIDSLYEAVLAIALSNPDLEALESEQMELVLHTVVCAQEPLTVAALAGLLKLSDTEVQEALRPLWSVLHVSKSGTNSRVSTLHASFSDYILDPNRSGRFACNTELHNGTLANLCFRRIEQNHCQFNICSLTSSYTFDKDVPNLAERVKQAIPLDLLYASQYWAVHLNLGQKSDVQAQALHEFLSERLLLWIEILNLTNRMERGVWLMERIIPWLRVIDSFKNVQLLAQDARRFVTIFAASPIAKSTPHIYVSMLASWPSSHPIAQCYFPRSISLTEIKGIEKAKRQLPLLSMTPVGSRVQSVAFSPNGVFFAAGTSNGTVLIWDASSYQMIIEPIMAHTLSVQTIAISPDSARICSGSSDGTISFWDPRSGQRMMPPLSHAGGINSVNYSPDGLWIVSGSYDGKVHIWDTQSGHSKSDPFEGNDGVIYSVAFSPDSSMIAAVSKSFIHLWSTVNGSLIDRLLRGLGPAYPAGAIAFFPGGNRLASSSDDGSVHIWDIASGRNVQQVNSIREHLMGVHALAISPNGSLCASGAADGTVRIYEVPSHAQPSTPRFLLWHTDTISSVAFSPDGLRLVSGSCDKNVRVWDLQGPEERAIEGTSEGHNDWVRSVAFSPCGRYILSGSDDLTIRMWDVRTGQSTLSPIKGHTGRVIAVKFLAENDLIASVSEDKMLGIWDTRNGDLKNMNGPIETDGDYDPYYQALWPVAVSSNGSRVICGSLLGGIYIWESRKLMFVLIGHAGAVSSIALSTNERFIVSGSRDASLIIWDASTGESLFNRLLGHNSPVRSVAFSPNCLLVASGSEDGAIGLWNAQNGHLIGGFLQGHTGAIHCTSFSPNCMYLVSGSQDKTVRVWDVNNGGSVAILDGHTDQVCTVTFSPDGTQIASGSADMTIRLWDPPVLDASSHDGSKELPGEIEPTTNYADWKMDENGWVQDSQNRLLLWVPPDLRSVLLQRHNSILISRKGCIELDFSNARIGEAWTTCYQPL